jgi:hypothetical protein
MATGHSIRYIERGNYSIRYLEISNRRIKMKLFLKVMLIIAAIYHFMNVLVGLVPPEWMGMAIPASTLPYLLMTMKFWGVASLPLGLIAWLVRNAEPSKTRDAVVLSMTLFFVVEAPVSAYGHFIDPGSPHLIFAFVEALIAVGFIIVGKASMSKKSI